MRWMQVNEAQNYLAMFNDFIGPDQQNANVFEKYITWARQTLKKNDRIVWFLRWVRVEMAGRIQHANSDTELAKLNKRMKSSYGRGDLMPINNLMTNLTHFLSVPVPKIQSVVWSNQSPQDLLHEFKEFEDEWKESSDQRNLIDYQDGDEPEVILKFPDGFAWYDLETSSCPRESKAMGHCGGWQSGATVLSLRKLVNDVDGTRHYYPVLTFILHNNGLLGEMKGRGNDKPVEKYHKYIVALLKLDLIQGIKGGGYLPENNFKISDLEPEEQKELLALKPELGDVWEMYHKEGMTKRVLDRVETALDAMDVDTSGLKYEPDEKRFIVWTFNDFERFISDIYDQDVEKILKIALGEDDPDYSGDVNESFFTTALSMPEEWQKRFMKRAGIEHDILDDNDIKQAAETLIARHDEWYETFLDVYSNSTDDAWERLAEYADIGWYYSFGDVSDNIPTNAKELKEFITSEQTVILTASEQGVIGLASSDDDDDDLSYDLRKMRGDGHTANFEAIDDEYLAERRREEKLISNKYGEGDPWLKNRTRDEHSLMQQYLNQLRGGGSQKINDPRQHEMNLEAELRKLIRDSQLIFG